MAQRVDYFSVIVLVFQAGSIYFDALALVALQWSASACTHVNTHRIVGD